MDVHWKDWCWSWNSNTLATWCEELTHLKRPWCWERLKAGEGYNRGWDGWMASPTQWTWVWVDGQGGLACCGSWGCKKSDTTERLNWTELNWMSQLFTSGGQIIEASASVSVLLVNIQGWFPLGVTGWISLQSKGVPRVFSSTTVWRHQFFGAQPFLLSSSHICTWLLEQSWEARCVGMSSFEELPLPLP